MNGVFEPTSSTNIIWVDDDMERCLTAELDSIDDDIAALETGKANTVHIHGQYADIDHIHSTYASTAELAALKGLVGDTSVSSQISSALQNVDVDLTGYATEAYVNTQVAGKVDKVDGKGLSTNDFTSAEKTKLSGIATGANKTTVDSSLSSSSTNPVQNKVINAKIKEITDSITPQRVFAGIADVGITTFPTTMKQVAAAMPANSMIIVDSRRVNGVASDYATETISDFGNTANGVVIITKAATAARISLLLIYGTTNASSTNVMYGNFAYDADRVNWTDLNDKFDDKLNKHKSYSGVDLNTLTEPGLYYVSSGSEALHYPIGTNGHVLVMSDGTRVRQVYFRVGTVDTNNYQWYSRSLGSDLTIGDNGWSQWWLMSGIELGWSGTAKLNAEINLGSRYGCQAWVIAGQVTATDTFSTVYVPRYFLTTNQTKHKIQISDETGYVSFYFYYKESDDNVYAKVIWVSDTTNSALRYAYRVS